MSDSLLRQTTPKPQWGHLTFGSQRMVSMEPSFTEKVCENSLVVRHLFTAAYQTPWKGILHYYTESSCQNLLHIPKARKNFFFPSCSERCNHPVSHFALPAAEFRSQFCSITLHMCSLSLLLYCMVFVFYQDRMVLCLWVLMFHYNLLRSLQIFLELDVI